MKECYLGIYWEKRKEIIEQCVPKIIDTFKYLVSIDNSFSEWYKTSKPQKGQAIEPISIDFESIERLLQGGQNYDDLGNLIESLGYLVYLKSNKDFSKSHTLSITCGSFSERSGNNVVLTISKDEKYFYLRDRAKLLPVYRKFVEIWNPQRGIIKCQGEEVTLTVAYN